MNLATICMGCMSDKGAAVVCPHCQYQEDASRSPLVLPYRTILNEKFLIGKVLGKPGGFGITYLAWDMILQTTAAIKEYLPREFAGRDRNGTTVTPFSQQDSQTFEYGLRQFLQEAQTLVTLNHANVIRIREFFRANSTAYLVMDYCKGISLEEYLARKGGKLPEKMALQIMLTVLSGLAEVHRKGFLHRDIKPNNIYLTQDNKVMLLDFGAARVAMSEQSKSLSVVLTPGFAPYEQYHSRGKQGPWTDIYACGATLYYLLTGVKPLDAIARYQHDDLVPPDRLIPGVSASVNQAIMQALAVEAADRPQNIQEFYRLFVSKNKETTPAPLEEQTIAQPRVGFRSPAPAPPPLPTPTTSSIRLRSQTPKPTPTPAVVPASSDTRTARLIVGIVLLALICMGGAALIWRMNTPKPLPPSPVAAERSPVSRTTPNTEPASLPPLSIQGRLLYDGKPLTDVTKVQPQFVFRRADTNQMVSPPPVVRYEQGAFFVHGLPPTGNFNLGVFVDTNPQNPPGYAGDFTVGMTGESFSLTGDAPPELVVHLQKYIHLTSPEDNSNIVVSFDTNCKDRVPLTSPVTFRWDSLGANVFYGYRVERRSCINGRYTFLERIADATATTTATEVSLDLPPNADDECYCFIMSAVKDGRNIGEMLVHGMHSWFWEYRFRVQ